MMNDRQKKKSFVRAHNTKHKTQPKKRMSDATGEGVAAPEQPDEEVSVEGVFVPHGWDPEKVCLSIPLNPSLSLSVFLCRKRKERRRRRGGEKAPTVVTDAAIVL